MLLFGVATASPFSGLLFGAPTALIDSAAGSASLFLGRPAGFVYMVASLSISVTSITTHLLLTMCSCFELLLLWRLGCTNPKSSCTQEVLHYLTSTFKMGSGPAAALFIKSGPCPVRLATATNIASLLTGVYPLGRCPCSTWWPDHAWAPVGRPRRQTPPTPPLPPTPLWTP